jgi:hypothetical protein
VAEDGMKMQVGLGNGYPKSVVLLSGKHFDLKKIILCCYQENSRLLRRHRFTGAAVLVS